MKVQRVRFSDGKQTWIVLDDNYLPVEPILAYIRYIEARELSPNTIHNYASHLKLYWEFLQDSAQDWRSVKITQLANFMAWLRLPDPKVVSIQEPESARSERTVNTIITVICEFYEYHRLSGEPVTLDAYTLKAQHGSNFKPFLHHISQGKPVRHKRLKLKEPKLHPGFLTQEQVKSLIDACSHKRDKFFVDLLYETGMRVGQALGLRHSDIRTWDNEIDIVWRDDNTNGARSKSKVSNTLHVPKELMSLYTQYLVDEYPVEVGSDYVFVNCWGGEIGRPLQYQNASELLERLGKKTGIDVHAHLFRHTHATELIREGWDMSRVQKRLGHANILTTMNTYVHLTDADLKKEYQKYLASKEDNND